MNSEHPILWKLIAAAPVLALRPELSVPVEWWQDAREWPFADRFMHQPHIPVTRLLFVGRLPTMLASATLIYLLWWFGSRLFGPAAGLISAGLAAFDPTVIAHGRLITTDIPVTLALLGAIVQLWCYVHAPSRRRLAGLIVLVAAALLVKYSAVVLFLMIPCLYWLMRRRGPLPMTTRRLTGLVIIGSVGIICVVYGADIARPGNDPRVRELLGPPTTATEAGRPIRQGLETLLNIPVPGYRYVRGLRGVVSQAYQGDPAYLLGRTSPHGWRWYFPVAFAVKTPLAYLALFCIALVGVSRLLHHTRGRLPEPLLFVVVPLMIYTAVTFPARFNVGIRHYLPAYPFWFLLVGWLWTERLRLANRFVRGLMLALLTGVPLAVALVHPYELAYFSEAVGGSRQGHKYLLDSNLDWGQDLLRLSAFQRQHPKVSLALDYFGTGDPVSYGVRAVDPPTPGDVASGQFTGIVVISMSRLLRNAPAEHWLQAYRPGGRIGSSLVWYPFPSE
jgi:4-amino-4-deoxy-L-arabinose transferase-like glycosyltransferase